MTNTKNSEADQETGLPGAGDKKPRDAGLPEYGWWGTLVGAVKTPLGLCVVGLLVMNGLLLALVPGVPEGDRTNLMYAGIGVLLVIVVLVVSAAVFRPGALQTIASGPFSVAAGTDVGLGVRLAPMMKFDAIEQHLNETFDTLERRSDYLKRFVERGDADRLFDGIASGILAAAQSMPTGTVDGAFFGNLMQLTPARDGLLVRSFLGTYSDQVVDRVFSLDPDSREAGLCTSVYAEGRRAIDHDGASLTRLRVERDTIKGLWCIPVLSPKEAKPGDIVVININSAIPNHFDADAGTHQPRPEQQSRERKLVELVRRLNRLRAAMAKSNPSAVAVV